MLYLSISQPHGSFFVTTINRTQASWLGAILMAENILGLLPTGTHEWNRFITIEELTSMLESCKSY